MTLALIESSLEGAYKKWVETVSSKGRSMTLELVPKSQCFPPDLMQWAGKKRKRIPVTESHKFEFTSQVINLQTSNELPVRRSDQFFLSYWCASHLVKDVTAASSKSTWTLDHSKV